MSNPMCSVCGLEEGTVGCRDPICGTCHFISGIAEAGSVNPEAKNGYDAAAAAWKKLEALAAARKLAAPTSRDQVPESFEVWDEEVGDLLPVKRDSGRSRRRATYLGGAEGFRQRAGRLLRSFCFTGGAPEGQTLNPAYAAWRIENMSLEEK